jgi:hypothetical protein
MIETQPPFSFVRACDNVPAALVQSFPFFLLGLIVWTLFARRMKFPRDVIPVSGFSTLLFLLLPMIWILVIPFVVGGLSRPLPWQGPTSRWIRSAPLTGSLLEFLLGSLFVWKLKGHRRFAVAYSAINLYLTLAVANVSSLAHTWPTL